MNSKKEIKNPALITHSILKWARIQYRHMSIEEVSSISKFSKEQIQIWEEGIEPISFAQLKKLAHTYKTSVTTFYLPEPPLLNRTKIIDRRILPFSKREFSPQLLTLIDTLLNKQEWLSQNLEKQEQKKIHFGNFSERSYIEDIVKDIKLKLNIDIKEQIRTKNNREALNLWIDKTESFGINVCSKSNQIQLEEFRAFVLYDDYAPFICLNSKDSPAGRLFSLCHELAHLWLKLSVISNSYEDNNEIEILCNKIASHLLIDETILKELWNTRRKHLPLAGQINTIARKFSISDECVARYLLEQGSISSEEYQELRKLYNARWKYLQKKKNGGGPIYGLRMVLENGAYFTRQVLAQYHKGTILGTEASSLLGVKIKHFSSLTEYLPPRI